VILWPSLFSYKDMHRSADDLDVTPPYSADAVAEDHDAEDVSR
jgi:hypothetical protein